MVKITCKCGYAANMKDFQISKKNYIKEYNRDGKNIKVTNTLIKYRCPSCGYEWEDEVGYDV